MFKHNDVLNVVDLKEGPSEYNWLPGVPSLLYEGKVYMGCDAFSKTRELVRSSFLTQTKL